LTENLHQSPAEGCGWPDSRRRDGSLNGIVARDPRVLAILTAPDAYFDNARRKAWREAREDIATDLDRRARRRRNGLLGNGAFPSNDDTRDHD
jgi:hypothetical protein